MSDYLYGIVGILILLVVIAAIVAKRRISKIDHQPPEHRAKENELYEALGLEKPREEKPEHHSEKQEEIEEAYGSLEVDVEAEEKPKE